MAITRGLFHAAARENRAARRMLGVLLAAASVSTACLTTGAMAGQFSIAPVAQPTFLMDGSAAKPTKAWAAFCLAAPTECRVDLTEPASFPLTDEAWTTIEQINRDVNRAVKAVTDLDYWGVGDRWDYPTDGYGDCEDIQLEKRRLLVEMGYPARALRIAMVINPEGEGHAVLVARTDRGDYVLDNRIEAVLPWYETGYVWVKREGDDDQMWVSLGGVRGPMETAGR